MTEREGEESFYKIGITNSHEVMHRFTKYGDEGRRQGAAQLTLPMGGFRIGFLFVGTTGGS
jgi:hypothetical protein